MKERHQLPIVPSACYTKMIANSQLAFVAEQAAKAPVDFKLNTLLKSGKKARREMYHQYYQNQYK